VKLGLSLLVALASYRLVEQPVRRGALRGRVGPASALGATVVAAALLLAATTGAVTVGGGDDEPEQATRLVDGPVLMVVGDSVARSLVTPIVRDPGRYGVNAVNQTYLGCTEMGDRHQVVNFGGQRVDPRSCGDRPRLPGRPAPDAVVLYLGARPNDAIDLDGETIRACDPRYDAILRQETLELLAAVNPRGLPSVVLTIPRSGRYAIPVAGAEERIACANRALADVVAAVPGAHLLDTDALVCPDPGPCREELGGGPLRSDGVHYDEGPGAQAVADWVVARVRELTGV
jgi:hypothetical protein